MRGKYFFCVPSMVNYGCAACDNRFAGYLSGEVRRKTSAGDDRTPSDDYTRRGA